MLLVKKVSLEASVTQRAGLDSDWLYCHPPPQSLTGGNESAWPPIRGSGSVPVGRKEWTGGKERSRVGQKGGEDSGGEERRVERRRGGQ